MKELSLDERLIIEPFITVDDGKGANLHRRLMVLAEKLSIGTIISINTALLFYGFGLIEELHSLGLKVLADLQLNTNEPRICDNTANQLAMYRPEIVTIASGLKRPLESDIQEILVRAEIWVNLIGDQHPVPDFQISLEHRFDGYISEAGVWATEWQKISRKKLQSEFRFVAKCYPFGALNPTWAIRRGADQVIIVVNEEDLDANFLARSQEEIAEGLVEEETIPDCPA